MSCALLSHYPRLSSLCLPCPQSAFSLQKMREQVSELEQENERLQQETHQSLMDTAKLRTENMALQAAIERLKAQTSGGWLSSEHALAREVK